MGARIITMSASAVMALAFMTANAVDVEFSYAFGNETETNVGTSKAETYDVAIRITDPALEGSVIKSVTIPFVDAPEGSLTDVSVWLSSDLKLENKVNVPDITSIPVEKVDGTSLTVSFPGDIKVPAGGVYVGYTFTVATLDEETKQPVICADVTNENGLYLHTKRTYLKWKSYSSTYGASSGMSVTLEGDFQPNSLGIVSMTAPYGSIGEAVEFPVTLSNHGTEPLSSLRYVVECNDTKQTETVEFNPAMNLAFGENVSLKFKMTLPEALGEYPVSVSVTEVNGVAQNDPGMTASSTASVFSVAPVNRPLVEEYTGTWCGWCPRGFAALEYMNKEYPETFVAISYHNGDEMARISSSEYPSSIPGYPAALINRKNFNDDMMADKGVMESEWKPYQEAFTPAAVNATAKMNEDKSIDVESKVTFVKSAEGSYKMAYAITANGLKSPTWIQSNYYSGYNPANYIPEMEKFCKGGSAVPGLVFDDIFAAGSNLKGEEDSLIENVVPDDVYTHSFHFDAAAGISSAGYDLFNNASELYAIVILIDNNGDIVNTNKVKVDGFTGVRNINEVSAEVESVYYNLNGQRVDNPSNGVYVKVATDANGNRTSSKVVVK